VIKTIWWEEVKTTDKKWAQEAGEGGYESGEGDGRLKTNNN